MSDKPPGWTPSWDYSLKEFIEANAAAFTTEWFVENLVKLTPEQRTFYVRMYPNGPSKDQIYNAADQISRTLRKNGVVPWPQSTW